jgi:bifunctional non-homologous end joining protein LigD
MGAEETPMVRDSIVLYYQNGPSDKEYRASIDEQPDGCSVNFAFGRRGSTLQTGTKVVRCSYEQARVVYDRLVREKEAKGYVQGGGTPTPAYTNATAVATGILPQLLNPIEEGEALRCIGDPTFGAQEKFDGKRILLRKKDGRVTGINRKGLECGIPSEIVVDAMSMEGDFVLDGECVGTLFHAFDILERDGTDVTSLPYHMRYEMLLPPGGVPVPTWIAKAPLARGSEEKSALLARLLHDNKEGIVFKRLDAAYVPGRPDSGGDQLKHKFYATCSCIVAGINARRSVSLELIGNRSPTFDPAGNGIHVNVGNCTIPPNKAIPQVGQIVEIRYLYAYRGGSLYQPTYIGVRDDLDVAACVLSQLKYKNEGETE